MSRTPPVVPDLPELPTGASLDQVIAWLQNLRTQAMTREPIAKGDSLQKFVTRGELVGLNVLEYRTGGSFGVGTLEGGGSGVTGGGSAPDLSAPNSITGLTVTPGLTNFFVEFDAPAYTQGHGNAYTQIYAANYSGTGPLPTFADAVEVYQVTGAATIAIIPAQTGQETHFWAGAVTVDGVRQVDGAGPTGGTNGVSATTGKVGSADLGSLVVLAGNLANGAVTLAKLGANSVDATKFAAGIEPIAVVSSVPTSLVTRTIFDTADGKLYRWSGSAYVATFAAGDLTGQITTTQITPGSITTPLLAAGSITTANLAAGSVTAACIAANTITAGQIAAGAITATAIAANAIAVGTAAIQNGAIVNAMLGTAVVDDAKIANVSAGKLTAGSIAVGQYIQSTGFTAGSSGWRILGNGTAEFSFAMIRDQLVASQIGAGQVTASKISVTQLDAISATIGTLRTASSGQRTEVQDNKIRVYDSSNVCRVKIGDLS